MHCIVAHGNKTHLLGEHQFCFVWNPNWNWINNNNCFELFQYPGCQEACKFHRESPQKKQVEPVIKARGEELLKVNDGVARWPRPGAVRSESPLIYIVMRRNQDSSWTQVIQTVGRSVRLPPDTATTALRVLVVNPDGLVTMYSPMSILPSVGKLSESKVSRILAGVVGPRNDKVNLNTPKSASWGLKEVSLIHQKVGFFIVLCSLCRDTCRTWRSKRIIVLEVLSWCKCRSKLRQSDYAAMCMLSGGMLFSLWRLF